MGIGRRITQTAMNFKNNIPLSQITPGTFSEDDRNGAPALGIITKLRTTQPKTQKAQGRVWRGGGCYQRWQSANYQMG